MNKVRMQCNRGNYLEEIRCNTDKHGQYKKENTFRKKCEKKWRSSMKILINPEKRKKTEIIQYKIICIAYVIT